MPEKKVRPANRCTGRRPKGLVKIQSAITNTSTKKNQESPSDEDHAKRSAKFAREIARSEFGRWGAW